MFKTQYAIRNTQDAKGFTLIEIITVLIIVAILTSIAIPQYFNFMERARGAEARDALSNIKKMAMTLINEGGAVAITNANVIIPLEIPIACVATHYFSYKITYTDPTATITATRCTGGAENGKNPNRVGINTVVLAINLSTGAETWTASSPY